MKKIDLYFTPPPPPSKNLGHNTAITGKCFVRLFFAAALAVTVFVVLVIGCGNPFIKELTTPLFDKIHGLDVTASSAYALRGRTTQFFPQMSSERGADKSVIWSVSGQTEGGTFIDDDGVLTVASGEAAAVLTVRAVSRSKPDKAGTAVVMVATATANLAALQAAISDTSLQEVILLAADIDVTSGITVGRNIVLTAERPVNLRRDSAFTAFSRKKKHLFDFDGDSGKTAYFCLCYENSKG